jgi:hypothetical protein
VKLATLIEEEFMPLGLRDDALKLPIRSFDAGDVLSPGPQDFWRIEWVSLGELEDYRWRPECLIHKIMIGE